MRTIIAGSRDFSDYQLLSDTMHSLFPDMDIEVVSGMARGADYLGYCFGKENGLVIHEIPANTRRTTGNTRLSPSLTTSSNNWRTNMKPFNLKLAKAGHSLLFRNSKYSYLAGPDPEGYVAVRSELGSICVRHEDQLCMASIGEVEGKPVYPGDTLYITENNASHAKVKRGDTFKPTAYGNAYLCNDDWTIHTAIS